MNAKWIANTFNINAILNKSAPERKTFLDKMLEDKKETERLLEKLQPFASQDRLDKLNKQLQVLDAKIKQVTNSLPPGIFNDPNKTLNQLGETFDFQFEDGTNTRFAVITAKGLESLLGKEEILRVINDADNGSPNTNRTFTDSENDSQGIFYCGFIANIDMYQQTALLKAIEEKTHIKNKFGFYNLNGGKNIYKSIPKALWDESGISGFFIGEQYLDNKVLSTYKPARLVYLNDKDLQLRTKHNIKYCYGMTHNGIYGQADLDKTHSGTGFIIGIILESKDQP